MQELTIARALEECLDAMEQGETDLDALSVRYLDLAEQVRPLLDIAAQLGELPPTRLPSAQFILDLGERLRTKD